MVKSALFQKLVTTTSPEETLKLGALLGARLRKGDVLSLEGNIGAGKTTFTKGLAKGLGIKIDASEVTSPTFVLMKEYPCRVPLFHVDLYRLDSVGENDRRIIEEGFESGVTVLEWGERARDFLPANRLEIEFHHEGVDARKMIFRPLGNFPWP